MEIEELPWGGVVLPVGWVICPDCLGVGGHHSDEPSSDYVIMPGYVWKACERCQGVGGWLEDG